MRSEDGHCVESRNRVGSGFQLAGVIAFLVSVLAASGAVAQSCGTWLQVPAGGTSLLGIGFGGGQFIGVGTLGTQASPDGLNWTASPINLEGGDLVRVAWNGKLWVAVGGGGRIYTSPNGTTWTPQVSQAPNALAGIAWGNDLWVAVGDLQTIVTSPDGTTWTQAIVPSSGYLTSVIWAGTKFVAVGQPGVVLTSSDGLSWSKVTIAGEEWLTDVVWTGSQLVAVAFDGTILTKGALNPWTAVAETGRALRRLVWTGGKYVAAGDANAIIASPDAITWEAEAISGQVGSGRLTGIVWSGTQAMIVGSPSGVLRSHCGVWANVSFSPTSPQIGQSINFSASKVQGIGRARWDFGEVGCDGASSTRDLVCLSNPCAFSTSFAFASAGPKTVSFSGWSGEQDGDGNHVYVLVRTTTLTVAGTGLCATCAPPGTPENPSPANSAVRPGGNVLLQWSAPATGTPPFTYDVELDGSTACAGTTAAQCQAVGVGESSTSHTWRVTAKNACGQKNSPVWTFLACSAPGIPVVDFDWQPAGPLPSWPAQQQPFPGQEVAFQDHSTNSPGDWAWSGLAASGLLGGREPRATWWFPGARGVGLRAANCLGWSDEKSKIVTVNADVRPRLWAFDFGTDGSPLAPGFTRISAGTIYSAALGYGWQVGVLGARDRSSGDDLVRDFVFGQNATFGVDVPNRSYDVALWLGDTGRPHDDMAVYLEGEQVDLVATASGEVVLRVYRVAVADGHLTVRIADLGGADPNFVVNGLEIFAADPVKVDFGTASSPVAAGYRRVSEGTSMAWPAWCGWSAGKIGGRDRTTGSDLLRDFNLTQDGTFSCAVGPGIWDVAVTLGDATSAHDQMGVFLEGTQVDSISRPAGQFATRKYRAKVGDGDLTLRLADLGGNDVNVVINSLDAVRVGPFDFGTATSPVAAGHVAVANTARYSPATGFGWLDGTVGSRDRGVGSDLLRDFNLTTGATFAVDVPNGAYEVTVVMGDASSAHDQMAIILEGTQAGIASTAKGKVFSRTFRTTVSDGQLTVRFEDKGGSDANAVINGLALAPAR